MTALFCFFAGIAIGSAVTTVVHTMRNPAMMRQSHEDFERLTAFVREWKA